MSTVSEGACHPSFVFSEHMGSVELLETMACRASKKGLASSHLSLWTLTRC